MESPRHSKFFSEMRSERLYAECLGGVMATVERIHSQFLSQRVSPMRAFTGDESVHTFCRRPL